MRRVLSLNSKSIRNKSKVWKCDWVAECLQCPAEWVNGHTLSWHKDTTEFALNQFAIHTVPFERFPYTNSLNLIVGKQSQYLCARSMHSEYSPVRAIKWRKKKSTKLNWILWKTFAMVACTIHAHEWIDRENQMDFPNTIITWIYYYLLSLITFLATRKSMIYWKFTNSSECRPTKRTNRTNSPYK